MSFYVNVAIRIDFEIRDTATALSTPSSITVTQIDPQKMRKKLTPTPNGTGKYYLSLTPTITGTWVFIVETSGAVAATGTTAFDVISPRY